MNIAFGPRNTSTMTEVLSLNNPAFSSLAFCTGVLALKMFAVVFLTIKNRFKNKVFAAEEDVKGMPGAKVSYAQPDIERARRIHLNDLENIPIFLFVAFIYILTGPAASTAIWHFRIFTISRVCHTLAYAIPIPQPSRALSFFVGIGVVISMAIRILSGATF